MAYAEDLLEQAQHLVRREPKKPKQASLRRAVSAAYYALFHLLIHETARNWKRPEDRSVLARMFEHGRMKGACEKMCSELTRYFKTDPPASPQLHMAKHLFLVANAFVRMQQHRHAAEYDGAKNWLRTPQGSQVRFQIDGVAAAFQSWKLIRKESVAQDFLVTLLLKDR